MPEINRYNLSTYRVIAKALFENYESIYGIDAETSAYKTYHESASYRKLKIKSSGENFFSSLATNVPGIVCEEDREYVLRMLEREQLLAGVRGSQVYSFIYRIRKDGMDIYHQIRAVLQTIEGREHILIGVRNIDEAMRREIAHRDELASMLQKERNHMTAILGGAAGYLEANLTKDTVVEMSPLFTMGKDAAAEALGQTPSYSALMDWIYERYIVSNKKRYGEISDRNYLISCYEKGEKRASVIFYLKIPGRESHPCRKVFYLYRDDASGDIFSFSVLYDLTEQQQREMELKQLEDELRMSRIRNFTSQMQPHFLYNALGSIQEIVLDDPVYASELIGDFTTHLRSCIRAMASDRPLPFSQELDNIKAYVNIEKMRFGEKLRICYEIGTDSFRILPLSIQPLVENAIRHGIYRRGPAGGTVWVRSREEPERWVVEVEDDGVGFDVEAVKKEQAAGTNDSAGLKNLVFRLDKVMHADVKIESTPGSGTKATVLIPKGGNL